MTAVYEPGDYVTVLAQPQPANDWEGADWDDALEALLDAYERGVLCRVLDRDQEGRLKIQIPGDRYGADFRPVYDTGVTPVDINELPRDFSAIDWLKFALDRDAVPHREPLEHIQQDERGARATDGYRAHIYHGALAVSDAHSSREWIDKIDTVVTYGEQLPLAITVNKSKLLALLSECDRQDSWDHVDLTGEFLEIKSPFNTVVRLSARYLYQAIFLMRGDITLRYGAGSDPVLLAQGPYTALLMPMTIPPA